MSTPKPITDHVRQGLSKLFTPFRNKPRFAAWFSTPLKQIQELEDAANVFAASWDVDTADLPRLTILGKIVGQNVRGTLEQFRTYVKVRVLVNRSRGRAPDLIKIARILVGGGTVTYTQYQPAAIMIEPDAAIPGLDGAGIAELLNEARLGGVRLNVIAQEDADAFLLGDDTSGGQVDATHGLSDDAETVGGYAAGIW